MRLLIIRHADPDNVNNTLTEQGFKEADALGEYLKDLEFKEIYSSPLNRAKFTSNAIMKYHEGKKVNFIDSFQEFNVRVEGDESIRGSHHSWDLYPSYMNKYEEFFKREEWLLHPDFKDNEILKSRYYQAICDLDAILEKHGYKRNGLTYKVEKESEETILIVCHFGMMSLLLSHLLNISFIQLSDSFGCPPTGITEVITEERQEGIAKWRLLHYGETTHLRYNGYEDSFHGRFCEIFSSPKRHD